MIDTNCKFMAYIKALYHKLYVVACNVKMAKSEYSSTIVQNTYNVNNISRIVHILLTSCLKAE